VSESGPGPSGSAAPGLCGADNVPSPSKVALYTMDNFYRVILKPSLRSAFVPLPAPDCLPLGGRSISRQCQWSITVMLAAVKTSGVG
jgi:hypothetical protein